MVCNRCKLEEATMVHSRKVRASGIIYEIRWCRPCQKDRLNIYNRKKRFTKAIKQPNGWIEQAKASELRILAKYGKVTL